MIMNLQMLPIQASFTTQEQAEAAIRKLASLRGDGFRLENAGGGDQAGPYREPNMLNENYMFLFWGDQADAALSPPAGSFTLSANVPAAALEQARSVIASVGGQIL
jgi:hypothetical protein